MLLFILFSSKELPNVDFHYKMYILAMLQTYAAKNRQTRVMIIYLPQKVMNMVNIYYQSISTNTDFNQLFKDVDTCEEI